MSKLEKRVNPNDLFMEAVIQITDIRFGLRMIDQMRSMLTKSLIELDIDPDEEFKAQSLNYDYSKDSYGLRNYCFIVLELFQKHREKVEPIFVKKIMKLNSFSKLKAQSYLSNLVRKLTAYFYQLDYSSGEVSELVSELIEQMNKVEQDNHSE